MFNTLKYDVTFPVTGRRLCADLEFAPGLSAISGRNEAGKSTVLEMLRFLLHGTAALRGMAEDYKMLKASGSFTVKGEDYHVERTIRSATLSRSGTVLATGTSVVNDKIREIFGYGANVFEVANFCGQGKVEALGEMRPAERKRMVDQTIGFDTIDELAKWVTEGSSVSRKSIGALERVMGETPTPPVKPSSYQEAGSIEAMIQKLQPLAEERQRLQGWLTATAARTRPPEPTCPVSVPVSVLETRLEGFKQAQAKKQELASKLTGLPEALYEPHQLTELEAQWKAYEVWLDHLAFVRRTGVQSQYTLSQLDELEAQWKAYEAWLDHETFLKRNPKPQHHIGALKLMEAQNISHRRWVEKQKLELAIAAADKITCPDCGSEFALHQEHVAKLRMELLDFIDVEACEKAALTDEQIQTEWKAYEAWSGRSTPTETAKPRLSMFEIAKERDNREAWRDHVTPPEVAKPSLSPDEIQLQWRALATAPVREEYNRLVVPPDPSNDLRLRQRYEDLFARFLVDKGEWELLQVQLRDNKVRLEEIGDVTSQIVTLVQMKNEAIEYEARSKSYLDAKDRYDQNLETLNEEKKRLDQLDKAAKALKTLRSKIKMHLVPSLNKVASEYLNRMTGGERRHVEVDEDFDAIVVDGQRLETLSGSAKAVANLAIRLGLGQVLTNRVFSVFMGDEIDASMDADRAGYTAECLDGLSKMISQIILVSHKRLEADHQIEL